MKKIIKRAAKLISVIAVFVIVFYIVFLRYFMMHWGASISESERIYIGDSVVEKPDYVNILAVTIDKPSSVIWPWVAQMGVNKGGFYSYTWLENIFGCQLHNADRIHSEWQNPAAGDYEPVCKSAEKSNMPGWTILYVEPGKSLVYKSTGDSSWTMGYYIDSVNATTSRLITRMRYTSPRTFWEYITDKVWMEWAHCIMQKGSINGIKKRAGKN
ncbi:MAG: hypothetical protein ABUT20_20030 [Bacteroidota bacterium]